MKAWETFKEYFMITVGVAIVAVSVYSFWFQAM